MYVTVILPAMLFWCVTWSLSRSGKNTDGGCLRTGCSGESLDLRGRKWQEAGEDCIMRSFITFMLHQTLLGDQVKEDEMGGACSTLRCDEKFRHSFGRKT